MPAGAAAPPRALPAGLLCARGLPQHKIAGVALVAGHLNPGAGKHLIEAAARERTVVGHRLDIEQDMTLGDIGVAAVDQLCDQRDHLRQVVGGQRHDRRRQVVERCHIVEVSLSVTGGKRCSALVVGGGRLDNFVVDIGDVARVIDPPVALLEQPIKGVKNYRWAGVANMHTVVNGRPADIHGDPLGALRHKRLLAAAGGIVELQHAVHQPCPRPLSRRPMVRLNTNCSPAESSRVK